MFRSGDYITGTHIYTCTHTHKYMHTYTYTYTQTYMRTSTYTHIYYMYGYFYTHIYTCTHRHTNSYLYTRTHTYIHTYTHNYIDFYSNSFHVPFHNDNNCHKDKVNKGDCVRSKRCIPKIYISFDNYDWTFQILKFLILLILSHYGTSYFHIYVLFLFIVGENSISKAMRWKRKKCCNYKYWTYYWGM